MSKLIWDATGERQFETGVDKGVLYPMNSSGTYGKGVAWNGLTSVSESPEGAEANDLWADNMKYGSLRSAESLKGTIEAYTYPDEFAMCDGSAEIAPGITIGQQDRQSFGLSYRSKIGNDANSNAGYKLHIIYGATASPSEKTYETTNDSPEANSFSWEFDTNPVNVKDHKPTANMTIDSTKVADGAMEKIEAILYGSESEEPRIILPDEILSIISGS